MNVTVGKILFGMINDRSTSYGILTTIGLDISGLVLLLMCQAGITLSIIGGLLFVWAYAEVSVHTPMLLVLYSEIRIMPVFIYNTLSDILKT